MLPARQNWRLEGTSPVEQREYGRGESGRKWAAHAEVVDRVVAVAQSKHECGRRGVARHANDDAVDGAVALDLHPIAPTTEFIAAIATLGDYSLDAWQECQ